jgi:hypothetical protein
MDQEISCSVTSDPAWRRGMARRRRDHGSDWGDSGRLGRCGPYPLGRASGTGGSGAADDRDFTERGIDMSKYRSAQAVLAGAAVIALAGCGASANTAPVASASSPAARASSQAGPAGVTASAASTSGATSGATSTSFAPAGSIPFPIAIGNTWVYETVSNINNAHALLTKKVISVTPVTGGHRVMMSSTLTPGPAPTLETYLFYNNGQIGFPVNEPHGVSVVSSNGVVWPDAADLASGRAFHSVLQIRLSSGQDETANVTVQGGGTASVTVPAGTYQATLVNMTMVSKVGGFTTTAVVKVWTAAGVGPVKSEDVIKAAGKTDLTTTEALVSFGKTAIRADGS